MSSRSDRFECRWRPSRALLTAYLVAQVLALASTVLLSIPLWAKAVVVLLCALHASRSLRMFILLDQPQSPAGLRRDSSGWALWSEEGGWQPVQLRPDSLALPHMVVLRFRAVTGHWLSRWWVRSLCIPADAMAPDSHRRLRLRLKFSRQRWAAPE
uniref:Toxin CptA n=1 Tax=Pseudomonas graminis TaxID=158627 RepID=A0A7C1WRW5_9PSED